MISTVCNSERKISMLLMPNSRRARQLAQHSQRQPNLAGSIAGNFWQLAVQLMHFWDKTARVSGFTSTLFETTLLRIIYKPPSKSNRCLYSGKTSKRLKSVETTGHWQVQFRIILNGLLETSLEYMYYGSRGLHIQSQRHDRRMARSDRRSLHPKVECCIHA